MSIRQVMIVAVLFAVSCEKNSSTALPRPQSSTPPPNRQPLHNSFTNHPYHHPTNQLFPTIPPSNHQTNPTISIQALNHHQPMPATQQPMVTSTTHSNHPSPPIATTHHPPIAGVVLWRSLKGGKTLLLALALSISSARSLFSLFSLSTSSASLCIASSNLLF